MKFRTLLRITVGGLFFGHGAHKLFGWWGGRGLDATAQGFESMGMRPGRANAIAAGVSEAGGGAALALGLASPLAESSLIATMLTAIHRVHLKNGIWATSGGYEYNLVLIIALLTLADTGPGPVSLDHALGLGAVRPGIGTGGACGRWRRRIRCLPDRRGICSGAGAGGNGPTCDGWRAGRRDRAVGSDSGGLIALGDELAITTPHHTIASVARKIAASITRISGFRMWKWIRAPTRTTRPSLI